MSGRTARIGKIEFYCNTFDLAHQRNSRSACQADFRYAFFFRGGVSSDPEIKRGRRCNSCVLYDAVFFSNLKTFTETS
jgi:hypothetical protein